MGWSSRLLALVLAVMAAACAADRPGAPTGIFFPTVPIGNAYPSGLMHGVLEVRSGCVFVAAHGDRWLLLWPEGYTAHLVEGQLEVLDESGEVVLGRASICASVAAKRIRGRLADRARPSAGQRA